jgi:putative endonuclease
VSSWPNYRHSGLSRIYKCKTRKQMKIFNRQTGTLGESLAANYLEKQGYQTVARNFHNRFGEIDLICLSKDKQTLIFIEVKTKIGHNFGSPEEMINRHKLEQVYRTSQIYLLNNPVYKSISTRIDIIAVTLDSNNQVKIINHYPGVY